MISREKIELLFRENFAERGELGAAVSIWKNGEPFLGLHGGFRDAHRQQPWTDDTIVLVWSATKGIGSACLLHAMQENKIAPARRVAEFWPEFGQNGKREITIAQLLSHSAGLCALDHNADVVDYAAVIASLQEQAPFWPPGTAHGYHARTFGFLIDELTRRITSASISAYWRSVFAEPLRLDFWIGLPRELNERCATIYAAKAGRAPEPAQFYRDLATRGTLQHKTFTSPRGLHAVSAMNKPENRALDIVSFGGIGSAHALAKFYAMLANGGELDGRRFFTPPTIALITSTITDGIDRVFEIATAFSAGFMKNSAYSQRHIFGDSPAAFGQPGAGGSTAFADPENNIAFAYVMNQMEQTLLPNEKSLRLVDAVYR
ncbi:MAG: beta-lactamase family protein [Verrucomicrobia bacterium]|nr:beta-lactamase family protein [Verrucomicrobiota bacterium]